MTPVFQTIFDADMGNCLAACIASILHLCIDEVPNFAGVDCQRMAQDWLGSRGLRFLTIGFAEYATFANTYFADHGDFCIVYGPSTYPDRDHAVVGRVNDAGGIEIVHDPLRGSGPLPGYRWVIFIVTR